MVLRLAERLDVPLRERNTLLLAAGYAPLYRERPLVDKALESARHAIDRLLAAHEPYPALAVDRHWNLVLANRLVAPLMAGAAAHLTTPPVNVLRLSLHPQGLAPRIVNYAQWREHLLQRLQRQVDVSSDPELAALLDELRGYQMGGSGADVEDEFAVNGVLVPLQLTVEAACFRCSAQRRSSVRRSTSRLPSLRSNLFSRPTRHHASAGTTRRDVVRSAS